MRKGLVIGIVLFVFGASPLLSQSSGPEIRFFAGLSSHLEDHYGSAFASGFGVSFPLNRHFLLGLDYLLWKSAVEGRNGQGLLEGDISITPFLLSLNYRILPQAKLSPYMLIGVGFISNNFRMGNVFTIPEVSISQKLNNGFGFHGGGGLRYGITGRISLHMDALFIFRKARGTTTINDMNLGISRETFTELLNAVVFRIGIIYSI